MRWREESNRLIEKLDDMAGGVKQQQDHYEAQLEEAHNEVEELKLKLEVK